MDRMKDRRIFTASFFTAPVINGSVRGPKKAVTVEDLLPNDFNHETDREEMNRIKEMIAREEEKRRKHGTQD